MNPNVQTALNTIGSALASALAMYAFGVVPEATSKQEIKVERDEYAANSQMIRDELSVCLDKLEKCWRECR